jgi:hypothetical protein
MPELEEGLKELGAAKEAAWLSTDFSTSITSLRGKHNGVESEITMDFRLRTLCFGVRVWNSGIEAMQVHEAFQQIRQVEEDFKQFKKWDAKSPTAGRPRLHCR